MKKLSLVALAVAGALAVVRALAATEPAPVKFTGGSPAAFQTVLDQSGLTTFSAGLPPGGTLISSFKVTRCGADTSAWTLMRNTASERTAKCCVRSTKPDASTTSISETFPD